MPIFAKSCSWRMCNLRHSTCRSRGSSSVRYRDRMKVHIQLQLCQSKLAEWRLVTSADWNIWRFTRGELCTEESEARQRRRVMRTFGIGLPQTNISHRAVRGTTLQEELHVTWCRFRCESCLWRGRQQNRSFKTDVKTAGVCQGEKCFSP